MPATPKSQIKSDKVKLTTAAVSSLTEFVLPVPMTHGAVILKNNSDSLPVCGGSATHKRKAPADVPRPKQPSAKRLIPVEKKTSSSDEDYDEDSDGGTTDPVDTRDPTPPENGKIKNNTRNKSKCAKIKPTKRVKPTPPTKRQTTSKRVQQKKEDVEYNCDNELTKDRVFKKDPAENSVSTHKENNPNNTACGKSGSGDNPDCDKNAGKVSAAAAEVCLEVKVMKSEELRESIDKTMETLMVSILDQTMQIICGARWDCEGISESPTTQLTVNTQGFISSIMPPRSTTSALHHLNVQHQLHNLGIRIANAAAIEIGLEEWQLKTSRLINAFPRQVHTTWSDFAKQLAHLLMASVESKEPPIV
jgi:hypothetical protein